jgi:hypothetical protein
MVDPILWSEIEVASLIVCACIPSIRPLIRKFPNLNNALGLSSIGKSFSGRHGSGKHGRSGKFGKVDGKNKGNPSQARAHDWNLGTTNSSVRISEDEESKRLEKEGIIIVTRHIEVGITRTRTSDSAYLSDGDDVDEKQNAQPRKTNRITPLYPGRLAGI